MSQVPWLGARKAPGLRSSHGLHFASRRPAHRERAPLRPYHAGPSGALDRVAPLIASGLHCGSQTMAGQIVDWRVAPLIASGLHCGHAGQLAGGEPVPVAPLIASGLHCGPQGWSLPASGPLGRPAHRERAPLRRVDLGDLCGVFLVVAPLIASGLHCGHSSTANVNASAVAPLIASGLHCGTRSYPASTTALPVAPLIASGLHCGDLDLSHTGHPGPVAPLIASGLHCGCAVPITSMTRKTSRPAHRERAPLRPQSDAGAVTLRDSRPAHRERAPLRLGDRVAVLAALQVAPLIASGLHCGPEVVLVCETGGRSPRSSRAGSIAAHSEPTGTG